MKIQIGDSHTDFLTALNNAKEREQYIAKCANSGVSIIICAVFTTESHFNINDIKKYNDEINRLSQKYNIDLLLSIEDMGFIRSDQKLNKLIELKPFSVTLTWNYANQYAGGALTTQGLTKLGIETINLLEQNNILVDTAHMGRQSFDEFTHITTKPIFNSHSNIYSTCSHPRNLTDEQINQIVQSNGYLGITLYDDFIAGHTVDSNAVAEQFNYLITKWDSFHFGYGTDLYGIHSNCLPVDIKGYQDLNKVSNQLQRMGHKAQTINNISCNNLQQFINRIRLLSTKKAT